MQLQDPLGQVLHRALRDKSLQPAAALYIKTYSVIADMVLAGGESASSICLPPAVTPTG